MATNSDDINFSDFFKEQPRSDLFDSIHKFHDFLNDAKTKGNYGYRRSLLEGNSASVLRRDDDGTERKMVMLGSNNYLDMANDPEVKKVVLEAVEKYGYGSGSVGLLAGTFDVHKKLEEKVAKYYSRESACVFPTGYAANLGTISALIQSNDLILIDMYAHMSIIDGTRLTKATVKMFKHNDMKHLRQILTKLRGKYESVLIITDGVFSMDGDLCHLPELVKIKKEFKCRLMIDEAHSVGIVGENGRGTEDYFNMTGEVDIITGTLSKAPGAIGGYIVGSEALVEYVRHFGNPYVFSTSIPPAVAAGLIKVYELFETDVPRRKKLQENAKYFSDKLVELGFDIGETKTPIIPVIIRDEIKTRQLVSMLDQEGIFTSAVVFPAVSKTQSRVRFSLMSSHSKEQLDFVLEAMDRLATELEIER